MNLDDILSNWKDDVKIDEVNLEKEIFKTPNLHAKYLEVYVFMKAKLASTEKKMAQIKFLKKKYYRGEMTREDLQKYGWEQYQGLKPSNSELNTMFDMDADISEQQEKITYFKTGVSAIEYIMKQLQQRDYSIKSVIDYRKYLNG